eukprot:scaffold52497_cov23-Cyclotella_meneghiniana.AAC.1
MWVDDRQQRKHTTAVGRRSADAIGWGECCNVIWAERGMASNLGMALMSVIVRGNNFFVSGGEA